MKFIPTLISESEVVLVGRKGAVGLAAIKLATLSYCVALVMKATPNGAMDSYLTGLVTLSGLFFAGNAAEHMAKRGQSDPPK